MADFNIKWEQVSIEERKLVVAMYNKYYNKDSEPVSFEQCDAY